MSGCFAISLSRILAPPAVMQEGHVALLHVRLGFLKYVGALLRRGTAWPSDFGGVFGHTPEHQESGAQNDNNPCHSDGQASERKVLAKENRVDEFNQSHHGIQSIKRD